MQFVLDHTEYVSAFLPSCSACNAPLDLQACSLPALQAHCLCHFSQHCHSVILRYGGAQAPWSRGAFSHSCNKTRDDWCEEHLYPLELYCGSHGSTHVWRAMQGSTHMSSTCSSLHHRDICLQSAIICCCKPVRASNVTSKLLKQVAQRHITMLIDWQR